MSADNITAAAKAIAAKLETLPDISKFYPHYRPVSTLGNGEGMMTPSGFTLPETMGPGTFQQVTWAGLVRLESALTSPSGGETLTKKITNLCSADPAKGIIGILRSGSADIDEEHGQPRVTEDGIDPGYDEEQDEAVNTFIPFSINANIRMGG